MKQVHFLIAILSPYMAMTSLGEDTQKDTVAKVEAKTINLEDDLKQRIQALAEKEAELKRITTFLREQEAVKDVHETADNCHDSVEDATELLKNYNTGGETLGAQTEVIEAIYAYAKENSSPCEGEGECEGGKKKQSIKQLLQTYLGMNKPSPSEGKEGEGSPQSGNEQPGEGEDGEEGDSAQKQPGKGGKGNSYNASSKQYGDIEGKGEERRFVPKAGGLNNDDIPAEFQEIINAYNKTLNN